MDRLSEIRARCEAAKEEKRRGNDIDCACLSWAVVLNDVPYLLAEIEHLAARAEKAEAERDELETEVIALRYMCDLD